MRLLNWLYRGGVALVLAYFVFQVTFFAVTVPHFMPPDEGHHVAQIYLYHRYKTIFLPYKQLNAYAGESSRSFFLYHYLMGQLLTFNRLTGLNPVLFLRLINVGLGTAYFVVFYFFACMILKSRLQVLLALFLHASLLMFTFLCGAVNNDNLVNLLSICSIYWVTRGYMRHEVKSAWLAAGCILFGCLVKQTFLPVAVSLTAILLWNYRSSLSTVLRAPLHHGTRGRMLMFRGLAAFVLLLLAANLGLYGKNLIQYGSIRPSAVAIYGAKRAYREHPVREKYKLLTDTALMEPGERLLDPIRYAFVWADFMVEKTIGIFAYQSYYPPHLAVGFYELLGICALGLLLVRRRDLLQREMVPLIVPLLFHTAVLIYYVNYPYYRLTGLFPKYTFIGIQGRYMFPVLAPLILLVVKGILSFKERRIRILVAVLVAIPIYMYSYSSLYSNPNGFVPNGILQERYIHALMLSQRYIDP